MILTDALDAPVSFGVRRERPIVFSRVAGRIDVEVGTGQGGQPRGLSGWAGQR